VVGIVRCGGSRKERGLNALDGYRAIWRFMSCGGNAKRLSWNMHLAADSVLQAAAGGAFQVTQACVEKLPRLRVEDATAVRMGLLFTWLSKTTRTSRLLSWSTNGFGRRVANYMVRTTRPKPACERGLLPKMAHNFDEKVSGLYEAYMPADLLSELAACQHQHSNHTPGSRPRQDHHRIIL